MFYKIQDFSIFVKMINIKIIYKIFIITLIFLTSACGTIKQNNISENSENKHVLPPNTASNKYSKIRQN